jgi:hypothetical protein
MFVYKMYCQVSENIYFIDTNQDEYTYAYVLKKNEQIASKELVGFSATKV